MASKAEWEREKRREKERKYLDSFVGRLDAASTMEAAVRVAMDGMPGNSSTGRLRHTNLLFMLQAFRSTGGTPPYALRDDYPLVPGHSTPGERRSYADLVRRLREAGEISQEDMETAVAALTPRGTSFVDVI